MTTMVQWGLSPPPGPPHPSCGRRPWSEPPWAAGIGDDRLAEGPWPLGHLEDFCGSVLNFWVAVHQWGPLGNVVFDCSSPCILYVLQEHRSIHQMLLMALLEISP